MMVSVTFHAFTLQVVHLLHGQRLPGAVEIVPGVFLGGEAAAEAEVLAGRVRPEA